MPRWPWPQHQNPDTTQEVVHAIANLWAHLDQQFSTQNQAIASLTARINIMSTTLQSGIDTLTAEVTRQTTVNASALALINGFSARLQAAIDAATAAGASPAQTAQLTALATTLTSNDDALAAGVTANTPAATP
jgi:hydroxymethylglutaryl-CoA reductase